MRNEISAIIKQVLIENGYEIDNLNVNKSNRPGYVIINVMIFSHSLKNMVKIQ